MCVCVSVSLCCVNAQISVARKKLDLANPAFITEQELRLGHAKKPEALAALVSVARGDPALHLRCVCV